MTSTTLQLPGGGIAIVCTRGQRQRYCTTPGCGRTSSRQCDHPVKRRKEPAAPKRGDARVHQERGVLFFVWALDVPGGTGVSVVEWLWVSTHDPSEVQHSPSKLQRISVVDWFAKTDATCDRLLCHRCAKKVDGLELCGPHYRQRKAAA